MSHNEDLADHGVAALLAAIASTEPAPGCGAAAGVALGLGVACARKAARISLKHGANPALARADAQLAALAEAGLALGDRDAAEMEALVAAARGPAEEEEERARALDRRRRDLLRTSRALVARCDAAARLAQDIMPLLRANVAGDGRAALALIAAARSIAADNADEAEEALGGR